MTDNIDLISRIIAWGLMGLAVFVMVLKYLGIIGSPTFETILIVWLSGLSAEMYSLERRLSKLEIAFKLTWADFKKRKKI